MSAQSTSDQQAVSEYLTELWRQLLKRDVTPTEDFFDAGGNSLTALRMVMEVQKTFHVDIDVESFFENSSITKLADIIAREGAGQKHA